MGGATFAHAWHPPAGWLGTLGPIVVAAVLLITFAIVMDRRPPE